MKKNDWKLCMLAFSASLAFMACDDDNNNGGNGGGQEENLELTGELTENLTLKSGNTYKLTGGYTVKEGATLTIEPGTTIEAVDDDVVDYILIEQGAQINANGSVDSPIIMTSTRKEPGAWGGIHICGRARINVEGGTGKSEIGDATYGGTDDADNSGTLRYVRVEYAGYKFNADKEANGFTFYGVGNGTTVEYLQAYKGSDDGFEWFGGSVNVKHLVSTDNSDDSFDWTEGWTGKGQYLLAVQEEQSTLNYECDALIEADNSDNETLTPISCPTLANMTLIGNNSTENTRGIRLRAGTHAKIYNTYVKGKPNCLTTETAQTETALKNGESVLHNVWIASAFVGEEGIYTATDFTADGTNRENYPLLLSNTYIGTADGGTDMTTVDAFFDAAAYVGAVPADNDWTQGWAVAPGSTSEDQIEILSGSLTENKTLAEGMTYYISGEYRVSDGVTLTIEPGVQVIAIDDDRVDYILVEQGGKLMAEGTAEKPIVMTAQREEPGAWGGIHLCGKARINVEGGTGKSEIGDATYGGDDDADNSGVLKYIRVEYAGYKFNADKEANGFTFYGVGNGTTLEHLQAYMGTDDGFEWFGGSVNVKYLVSTNNSDDSFDWTEGWTGKGQFMIAYQAEQSALGYECDALIEADNSDNETLTPVSCPVLANLTLVGNSSEESPRGVRLRAGTYAKIYNALVSGKPNCLTVETRETDQSLTDGNSILNNVWIASDFVNEEENPTFTAEDFAAQVGNMVNASFGFEDGFFGTQAGGTDMTAVDGFFSNADYKGAISKDNDWTAGWTK